MGKQLPLHHGRYHDLFVQSLRLYRLAFSEVFPLSLIFSFISFIPRVLTVIFEKRTPLIVTYNDPYWLLIFLINVLCLIFFMGILWRVSQVKQNIPLRHPFYLNLKLKKIFNAIAAGILQNLLLYAFVVVIFSFHLLFFKHLPQSTVGRGFFYMFYIGQFFLMLYLSTLFLFVVPIIAIQNRWIFPAIQKSISLVWNHWWRVFSMQITPWFFYFLILIFVRYALRINVRFFFEIDTLGTLLSIFLHLLILSIFIPWIASTLILQLNDLEIRKTRMQA